MRVANATAGSEDRQATIEWERGMWGRAEPNPQKVLGDLDNASQAKPTYCKTKSTNSGQMTSGDATRSQSG